MDTGLTEVKRGKCCFCGLYKIDYLNLGPLYKVGKINAHYFCVLLSRELHQRGKDNEGLLGFLISDIQKVLRKSINKKCCYCKKGCATLECVYNKCRKKFHLPCGLEAGSSHQFMNDFPTFCHSHKFLQQIPVDVIREASNLTLLCCVCYDPVDVKNKTVAVWAPCCEKTWYHRICLQKLALSAGYFFKCPSCNDNKKFVKSMQLCGIFIPQQDASWELVPNAYEELLYRYDKCDAKKCVCPKGRQANSENTMWEIVLCMCCGSQGMHVGCGDLKFIDPEWECPSCQEISKKLMAAKKNDFSQKSEEGSSCCIENYEKKRRRDSEDLENSVLDKRKKCRLSETKEEEEDDDDEDEDDEVDVETLDEESKTECSQKEIVVLTGEDEIVDVEKEVEEKFEELLALLKPGPLSYKLRLIQKVRENLEKELGVKVVEVSDEDSEDDVQLLKDV